MSEVIVRMEMPKGCYACDLADGVVCMATGGVYGREVPKMTWIKTRPSWCPIIGELPEHGDLIDRDELIKHKRHSEEFCENIVSVAQIDWMPTIVPATERSETNGNAD